MYDLQKSDLEKSKGGLHGMGGSGMPKMSVVFVPDFTSIYILLYISKWASPSPPRRRWFFLQCGEVAVQIDPFKKN